MATSIPATADANECHVCSETGKKSCTACGTEIVPYGAHGLACPKCAEQEIDKLNAESAAQDLRAARIDEDRNADKRLPKMLRLQKMAASPPSDLSGWGQRLTDLYDLRMRPVKKLFGSRGPTPAQQAEYDAEKKLWGSLDRKARAEHKRFLDASNAGLPPPSVKTSRSPRANKASPSLPDPTTRRGGDGYRSEADILADIFNEEGVWQAEPRPIRMSGRAGGIRLAIYPEDRGPSHAVAIATIIDGVTDIEWLSPTLPPAARSEISRRVRTAVATHTDDSAIRDDRGPDAPSPLAELTAATEKRALELGAKPARTRSTGRVTSENPEERRLGEAVRDLRDRTELDEAIKWLESADLNLDFDIGERTSELDSVDKLMSEVWRSILDTASIDLGGVRGEGRGAERVFYISPDMIFDANSMPFLMEHVREAVSASTGHALVRLREVPINVIYPGDGDSFSAKVVDKQHVLTNDSRVHINERGADFIRSLYRNMKSLRDDLSRAPKALDDVRKLLYWTGAMLDTPRCQDATHSRALESFEAAKVAYDQARQHVVNYGTTSSELASIKAPLRKAAVSAAKLATDCGEGQVDIFSVRPSLPPPERPRLPLPDEMQASRHEPPPIPPEGPETPLHQQDPDSVDVLNRLLAALSEVFIVTPIRSGHGYHVVDLRSKSTDGVFTGLPRNTYLTTVSLRHSKAPEFIGDKAYLVQSIRDAGRSQDQHRAILRFMVETVERLAAEAQGKVAEDEPEDETRAPPPPPNPSARSTQAPDTAKIADRVRKLLALAERAGTPEEAGTAYATAQRLIAQHALSEEQLRQARLRDTGLRANEPIVMAIVYVSPVSQMPTWIGVLGLCLAQTNGCELAQGHGPRREVVLKAWGRPSDLALVEELLRVVPGQIDALCDRSPFTGRTARNNFRIGAVTVVCERLRAAARDARLTIEQAAAQTDTSTSAPITALALVALDNRNALAKGQMYRDCPNLRAKTSSFRGDHAARDAGRAAGATMNVSRQRAIR